LCSNAVQLKKDVHLEFLKYSPDYSCDDLQKQVRWIVRDWGRINTKEETENNIIDQLKNELLSFNRISSTSKVLSFKDSEGV